MKLLLVSHHFPPMGGAGVQRALKFVRYLGDKTVMGIVRSTSIDWSLPKQRQTIKLETHV